MALTKVSYSMIQDGFVDIRDFGAACDWNGTTGTDDTAAIQAAINYGIANKKAVFFPGMSKITSPVRVAADTRGLQIFGVDRRNTGIHNASTSAGDALIIGNSSTDTYDISIHDFRIEGNGNYTDGKGLAMYLCHHCQIQNVMVEFVGSHGIYLSNVNQSTVINTHTRRCGYNTGITSIGGLYLKGNSGMSIYNHLSDECSVGVVCDTGGFYIDGLDTENNQLGGLRAIGECNIQITNGYLEQAIPGNNNWYFGDGSSVIQFVFLKNCVTGNGAYWYFNKVQYYEIDQCGFDAAGGNESMYIVDPTYTRGTLKGIWAAFAAKGVADSATIIQHCPSVPAKLTSFNNRLGDNGSFEIDLTTDWSKDFYSGGTAVVTDVAGLGHDVGTHACEVEVTVATSVYRLRPTYPTTTAGRFYTLEFDYTASTNDFYVTCTTGSQRHFNFQLPQTTDSQHYRIVFLAQGTINELEWQIKDVGTFVLDGVTLYEGVYGQN